MKQIAIWLVRLYPSAWRVRYEDEFTEFLEQHHSIYLYGVLDIFIGICDAYLNPQRSIVMSEQFARKQSTFVVTGLCPLISTGLFLIGLAVLSTYEVIGLLLILLSIVPNILLPFILARSARQRLIIGVASPLIALAVGLSALMIFDIPIPRGLSGWRVAEMLFGAIGVALILANLKDNGLPRPLAVVGILLGADWLLHHSLMMLEAGSPSAEPPDQGLTGVTVMILLALGLTWVLGTFIWLALRERKALFRWMA
jgi:hypothetical protein